MSKPSESRVDAMSVTVLTVFLSSSQRVWVGAKGSDVGWVQGVDIEPESSQMRTMSKDSRERSLRAILAEISWRWQRSRKRAMSVADSAGGWGGLVLEPAPVSPDQEGA